MANEITVSSRLKVSNGNLAIDMNPGSLQFDQTARRAFAAVQDIGTSAEAVVTGDISTLGWAWFRNLDDTNYVEVGPDSGGSLVGFCKLKASEVAGPFRLKPGITIKAQANTATVKLQVVVFDD